MVHIEFVASLAQVRGQAASQNFFFSHPVPIMSNFDLILQLLLRLHTPNLPPSYYFFSSFACWDSHALAKQFWKFPFFASPFPFNLMRSIHVKCPCTFFVYIYTSLKNSRILKMRYTQCPWLDCIVKSVRWYLDIQTAMACRMKTLYTMTEYTPSKLYPGQCYISI